MTIDVVPDFTQLSDTKLLERVQRGPTVPEIWLAVLDEACRKRNLHDAVLRIFANNIEAIMHESLEETPRLLAYLKGLDQVEIAFNLSRQRVACACLTIATLEAEGMSKRSCELFEHALHWGAKLTGVHCLDTLIDIGKKVRCAHHRWVVLFNMKQALERPDVKPAELSKRVDWPRETVTAPFSSPPPKTDAELICAAHLREQGATVVALLDPARFHAWWITVEHHYSPRARRIIAGELRAIVKKREAGASPRYETASLKRIIKLLLGHQTYGLH